MRFTLSDVLTGLLVTVLIGTATAATAVRQREVSNRQRCASNLRQIGVALLLYQTENHQSYPRTAYDESAAPTPTWGTPYADDGKPGATKDADPFDAKSSVSPKANDVTAPWMLLVRTKIIDIGNLVCPSTAATPFDFGGGFNTARNFTNFPGKAALAAHLSYAYMNVYPAKAAADRGFTVKDQDQTYAVAADIGAGGKPAVELAPADPDAKQRLANSPNHQQDGQNVLYGDGHADFMPTVFAGTRHDNIYTAAGPEVKEDGREAAGKSTGSPCSGTDSVLLPTVAEVGTPPPAK